MTHSLARPLTLLLFALSAEPVIAQLPSRGVAVSMAARGATPTANSCCVSSATPATAARLDAGSAQADSLFADGRLRAARAVLAQIVREQSASAVSAVPRLRQLANVEFALGHPLAAARALERVADGAERVGDLAGRLEALVDASMLYVEAGRPRQARALVSAAQLLLRSPAIPDAARLSAARRIGYR